MTLPLLRATLGSSTSQPTVAIIRTGENTAVAEAAASRAESSAPSANTALLRAAIRNNGFFPQPSWRTAANDVATITIGAAGAAPTIPSYFYAAPEASAGKLNWVSGPAITGGASDRYARGAYNPALGGRSPLYDAFEFTNTSDKFEVAMNAGIPGTGNFRVLVNDKIAGVGTVPSDGTNRNILCTFPTSATRRIRIETAGGHGHFGIAATSAGAIAQTGRTYPLWSVIADSFGEGTGTTTFDGEAVTLVRAMGGSINLAAVGGTGILNPGTGGKVVWTDAERLKDLALNGVTDVITAAAPDAKAGIIMMSINDQALAAGVFGSGATYQEAIARGLWTMIDHWQANRSGKPLFVFGPTWSNSAPTMDIYRMRDAGAEACNGVANVWFIDRLEPGPRLRGGSRLVTTTTGNTTNASKIITTLASLANVAVGSGISGSGIPTGARVMSLDSATQVTIDLNCTATATGVTIKFLNDQSAIYTDADGTHPNPAGHNLDGLWMADRIREIILTQLA